MFDQRKKFRSITKCDGIITHCDSLVYYKVRWTVRSRQSYKANFDSDSVLDICQESGERRLNRLAFSLWRLVKAQLIKGKLR